MQLTLQQAAASLGKTRRQIQYLIQQGRLPAKKVGGRWYVESAGMVQDPVPNRRCRDQAWFGVVDEAHAPGGGQVTAAAQFPVQPGQIPIHIQLEGGHGSPPPVTAAAQAPGAPQGAQGGQTGETSGRD